MGIYSHLFSGFRFAVQEYNCFCGFFQGGVPAIYVVMFVATQYLLSPPDPKPETLNTQSCS